MSAALVLGLFAVSFLKVGLRAFQQRSVTLDSGAMAVIPVSYGMSYADLFLISAVAWQRDWAVLAAGGFAMGTGAWMGTLLAVWLHRRWGLS